MVNAGRLRAMVSTTALVVGALLIGDAINGALVAGRFPASSPSALFRLLGGAGLVYLGYRWKTDLQEYIDTPAGRPRPEPDDEAADPEAPAEAAGEFDPSLSPLGGDAPGGSERGEPDSGRSRSREYGRDDESASDSRSDRRE